MAESMRRQQTPARRALQEALLDEVGLDDVLDGVARLGKRRGDRLDADRTTAEGFGNDGEIAPVHLVEAALVHLEEGEGARGQLARDALGLVDHGEIPHSPQQPAGDAGRAAGALGDLVRAIFRYRKSHDARAALHDEFELFHGVEVEADGNAETVAQRRGEEAGPGRRADEREFRQVDLHRARRGPSPITRSSWKSSIAG